MAEVTLITGGVKSGKSRLGSQLLEQHTDSPCIVATARRTDSEMSQRIDQHQRDRGAHWRCVEAPLAIAQALRSHAGPVLIDCLGVWLTNLLIEKPDEVPSYQQELLTALQARTSPTVVVSNECGLGVIGADALTRCFVDALGLYNQRLANLADQVILTAAGQALWLKGKPQPSQAHKP